MRFGVLLPHFGPYASRELLLDGTRRLEELGFDSVWVRDHVAWRPLPMDYEGARFVDPFVSLAAVAAGTAKIELGTLALIPIRHPVVVAQNFASVSFVGQRRVEASFGLGSNLAELGVVGVSREDRVEIFMETHEICRRLWTEDRVTFHGKQFSFEDASVALRPVQPIRTWYAGTTRGAIRRAVAAGCDGFMAGRLTLATLDDRLGLLRELLEPDGRRMILGIMPVFYLDEDRAGIRARIDVEALVGSSRGHGYWIKPPSGEFRTLEDIQGVCVAGTRDDCVEQIDALRERGIEYFIFDLRLQFDRFEEVAEEVAREILPRVRELPPIAAGSTTSTR